MGFAGCRIGHVQAQRGLRGIVAGQLPWRVRGGWVGVVVVQVAHHVGDRLGRDAAGAQQGGAVAGPADDGGFKAHRAGTGIKDGGDPSIKATVGIQHMGGAGRADPARGIGRGRGQRACQAQQGLGDRMGGHAQCDC